MGFNEFFAEAMDNEVEEKEEFDPKEIELGLEEEAVHKDLYEKIKLWAEENELEMPMSEEEFLMDIITAHLKENPTEYTDSLKCKEEKGSEDVEEVEEATSPAAISMVNKWKKK